MVFWWPAGTAPDTYDGRLRAGDDMAVGCYTELYGEAPEAEIVGKLAMVSDLDSVFICG